MVWSEVREGEKLQEVCICQLLPLFVFIPALCVVLCGCAHPCWLQWSWFAAWSVLVSRCVRDADESDSWRSSAGPYYPALSPGCVPAAPSFCRYVLISSVCFLDSNKCHLSHGIPSLVKFNLPAPLPHKHTKQVICLPSVFVALKVTTHERTMKKERDKAGWETKVLRKRMKSQTWPRGRHSRTEMFSNISLSLNNTQTDGSMGKSCV